MKKLVLVAFVFALLGACSGEQKEEKKEDNVVQPKLKSMETKTAKELEDGAKNLDLLIKENMPNINKEQYIAAINTHYQFSQNFPEHKDAAYHLDKAQGYCQQIKDFPRSEKMLAQLFRDYPEYAAQNNGELYYLRATNLDYILSETKNGAAYKREAKKVYEEFIEKFPDNPLVEDAKYRLENFDLTTDQIIAKGKK
ncbi:MAG: hypothetical protein R2799_14235 [Crocinitomicaceae bacterium]